MRLMTWRALLFISALECQSIRETRVHSAFDDLASTIIRQCLPLGRLLIEPPRDLLVVRVAALGGQLVGQAVQMIARVPP
jgi:hypothetical protein